MLNEAKFFIKFDFDEEKLIVICNKIAPSKIGFEALIELQKYLEDDKENPSFGYMPNLLNNNPHCVFQAGNFLIFLEKTPIYQTRNLKDCLIVLIGLFELLSIEIPKKANVLKAIIHIMGKIPVKVTKKVNKLLKNVI